MAASPLLQPIKLGLLTPLSGPIGLLGPSSINCAKLAVREINDDGGIFGRPLTLVAGDGGGDAGDIARVAEEMIGQGAQAIVGTHVSTNRVALVEAIGGRVPYVYTTMYEGGEYSFGVFLCGETPEHNLLPLLRWLTRNRQVRSWYLIGNDYVFPRLSMLRARQQMAELGGRIVGEEYLPFLVDDFSASLDRIAASGADAVLSYLVGTDGIVFHRQFAERGLASSMIRAAPVTCENSLLGIGADATGEMYTATGFANSMASPSTASFRDRYRACFGDAAPILNRFGLSCYEGVHLLASLARRAGSLNLFKLQIAADGLSLSGPRGECRLSGNHLGSEVHIARANGNEFELLDHMGYMEPPGPPRAIWPPEAGRA